MYCPLLNQLPSIQKTIIDPYSIQYYLEKALYYALEGRPGPVWLDIPFDIQSSQIIDSNQMRVFIPPQIRELSLDNINSHIDLVLEKIHKAKKPLFILGQGVRQGGAIDDFRRIVESLDIPFVITRIAIDVFKTSFRNNIGLAGMRGTRYSKKVMDECDLVLSFGCSMNSGFTIDS